jgi:hypothetical protein
MKKIIALSVLIIASSIAFGQHNKMEKWTELKNFHEVMSQTYHPSEEGNFKPIRARAAEMLIKAEALQKSKAPAEFDNESTKAAVNQLVVSVREVKMAIELGNPDSDIKILLAIAHDKFHNLIGEKEEHKHHDKH